MWSNNNSGYPPFVAVFHCHDAQEYTRKGTYRDPGAHDNNGIVLQSTSDDAMAPSLQAVKQSLLHKQRKKY